MKSYIDFKEHVEKVFEESTKEIVEKLVIAGSSEGLAKEVANIQLQGMNIGAPIGFMVASKCFDETLIMIRNCLAQGDLDGIARTLRSVNIPCTFPKA